MTDFDKNQPNPNHPNTGPLSQEEMAQILPVACCLYEKRGAMGVSFDALGQATHTDTGRLVKHFKTRVRLSREVGLYCLAQQQDLMVTLHHAGEPNEQGVRAVLAYCQRFCEAPLQVGWLGHWALQTCQRGALAEELHQYYQSHWGGIFTWCARVHHSDDAVPMIVEHALSLWHGLRFMQTIGTAQADNQWFIPALTQLFLPGREPSLPPLPAQALNTAQDRQSCA